MNYPYIIFHGYDSEKNEIELRKLLKNQYEIEIKGKRQEVNLKKNVYIYCYIKSNIIYINTIDIFCSEKTVISYAFEYLHSQSSYIQNNVYLVLINIHKSKTLCELLKIYIEKYPHINIFITSSTINSLFSFSSYFYKISVKAELKEPIDIDIDFNIQELKSQVHYLILNYFDSRYILKMLIHKAITNTKKTNYKEIYDVATKLDLMLNNSNDVDHFVILEHFIIKFLL